MSKFKVGDKVVCTLKERPSYFNKYGGMDYMLDRKEVLEVVFTNEDRVGVLGKNDVERWFLRNEDIELYEEKPYVCATCAIDNIVKKSKTLSEWHKELELITLIDKVKEWSIERNIDQANPKEQTLKLLEEVGELASALLKSNNDLIIDSLGDILVVLIILHQQLGLTMEQTLNTAYNEIKDRKGKTIGGVFVKDSDIKKKLTKL